jgi:hypothetical protein
MKNYRIIFDLEESRIEITKTHPVDEEEVFATFEEAQTELDNYLSSMIQRMQSRLAFIKNNPPVK